MSMWGQVVAGVVLCVAIGFLTSSEQKYYSGYWPYALSVGIVGSVFAFIGAMLLRNPNVDKPVVNVGPLGMQSYSGLLAIFLFIWWCVGTGFITINGPFEDTKYVSANG